MAMAVRAATVAVPASVPVPVIPSVVARLGRGGQGQAQGERKGGSGGQTAKGHDTTSVVRDGIPGPEGARSVPPADDGRWKNFWGRGGPRAPRRRPRGGQRRPRARSQ